MKQIGHYSVPGGHGLVGTSIRKGSVKRAAFFLLIIAISYLLPTALRAEEISARAAVVIDGNTDRILYAKNPNLKLPPASTTKLVTAMVALDRLNPESIITISKAAANTPSVSPRLRAGEKFSTRDVLDLALMRSVNGAAVALAEAAAGSEAAFVILMNEKVARIGAENTRFINASGLPGPDQYITAYDLASVMKESLRYQMIKEIINTRTKKIYSVNGRRVFVKNTNELLWADEDLLGGKTGYTRAARHCFVCAAEKGKDVVVAAMLGESVRSDLWQDSRVLLSKGYDVLAQKSEPMIYFSNPEETPIVRASYKPNKGKKKFISRNKKHKKSAAKLKADKKKMRNIAIVKVNKKKMRNVAIVKVNKKKMRNVAIVKVNKKKMRNVATVKVNKKKMRNVATVNMDKKNKGNDVKVRTDRSKLKKNVPSKVAGEEGKKASGKDLT